MPKSILDNYTSVFTQIMEHKLDEARSATDVFANNPLSGIADSIKKTGATIIAAIGVPTYALELSTGVAGILVIGGAKYSYNCCREMQNVATWIKNKNEISLFNEKLLAHLKEVYHHDIEKNLPFDESLVERVSLNWASIMTLRAVHPEERRAMRDVARILKYMSSHPCSISLDDDLDQSQRFALLVDFINTDPSIWESNEEEDILPPNVRGAISHSVGGEAMVLLTRKSNAPNNSRSSLQSSPQTSSEKALMKPM